MKKIYYGLLFLLFTGTLFAQDIYFPPLDGSEWETLAPSELNWCEENIEVFYDFLGDRNTKAFILLKDGKIVLEQYYDGFTPDDLWYWASVGKSMMAALTGIAQQDGHLDIEDPTSDYLGTAWTSLPEEKEQLIKIRHQLSMTTGLDDAGDNTCTLPSCLKYLADAGDRWAYHNATYYLMADVLEAATGKEFNQYFHDEITQSTGISGQWQNSGYAKILYTTPRDLARFGLLFLNEGHWGDTPVLEEEEYFNAMINTAQEFNESYGYFWWLNGKSSYMFPMTQNVFPGSLVPNAPEDTYAGIGNNGQYVNVVPSKGFVMVRMGDFPGGPPAPNIFNAEIWDFINQLECQTNASGQIAEESLKLYPNPISDHLQIDLPQDIGPYSIEIYDLLGQLQLRRKNTFTIDLSTLPQGNYYLLLRNESGAVRKMFTKS